MSVAQAFFLPSPKGLGQRYALYHAPQQPCRGLVLYLHPFAEEMNKSRRMAALQSRALATAGFAVLQIDLRGCGDSSDDFGDASWDDWVDDAELGLKLLRERHGEQQPIWLWGIRAGCLVAHGLAQRHALNCHFLFWQPTVQGRLVLQQFLRLKAAAALADGGGKGVVEQLRECLRQGESVEVAGYALGPALCAGLEQSSLQSAPTSAEDPQARRVVWIEQARGAATNLSPVSAAALQSWREAGFAVEVSLEPGPPFWQATEIEEAPQWISATQRLLCHERVLEQV